jgi:hypothetical protein
MDIAILRMLGAHDAATGRRCAAWRATERVVRYCPSPVAPGDIGPRLVNFRTRRQGEPPVGGRKPRFPLGPAQYHRPMWSLFYRVIRILVASSSSEISVNVTSKRRTSRSSSSATSSRCCSGRPADQGSGPSSGSYSRRRVGSSRVSAGSPSSSPRPSSGGIANSCAGSGPTAGPVAQAGHRLMPTSVRSSSEWPGRIPAGAACGSRASFASSACE